MAYLLISQATLPFTSITSEALANPSLHGQSCACISQYGSWSQGYALPSQYSLSTFELVHVHDIASLFQLLTSCLHSCTKLHMVHQTGDRGGEGKCKYNVLCIHKLCSAFHRLCRHTSAFF